MPNIINIYSIMNNTKKKKNDNDIDVKSSSLPNIKHKSTLSSFHILTKIKQTHLQNINSTIKAYDANLTKVSQYEKRKDFFQKNTLQDEETRINNIKQSKLKNTEQKSRILNSSFQKANTNRKTCYQIFQKRTKQLKQIQQSRERSVQKNKTRLKQCTKIIPIEDRRFVIYNRQRQQQLYSIQLMKKSDHKLQAAMVKREKINSKRIVGQLDKQLLIAKQIVQQMLLQRQHKFIEKSVKKQQNHSQRKEKSLQQQRLEISQKQRKWQQKSKEAHIKRLKVLQETNKNYQTDFQKINQKMQRSIQAKKSMIKNQQDMLRSKMTQLRSKADMKNMTLRKQSRKRADEQVQKQNDDWSFITGLRKEVKKTIEHNIYENNKLSIAR